MAQPLERERELAAIDTCIESAVSGDGGVVVLEAGPGLGKTALIEAARRRAEAAGLRVLSAIGSTLETTFAFGLVVQLLLPALRAEGSDPDLFEGAAALAEPLLAGVAAAPEMSAFALLNALYWLTVNLAERKPLALLVDDLHWADPSSVRFLSYVTNRLGGVPVALIAATRPPHAELASEELLTLARAPDAVLLSPAPLSPEAVTELVREWRPDAADEFCDACRRATAGNPLFLRELLVALESEGIAPTAAATSRVALIGPAPVSRAVYLSLRRLAPEATDVARALAILGDGATVTEVAALAGLDEDVAVRAASSLASASLLHGSDRLAFAHPIVRQALYEEMQPVERGRGHRKAAQLLLALEAEPARVAAQLLEAPPAASTAAVTALRAAATEASHRGDPSTAVLLLRRALREPPDDAELGATLFELGRAEFSAGHPNAIDRLESARDASAEPLERAAVSGVLGRAYYAAGRFKDAIEVFGSARDEVRDLDPLLSLNLNAGWAASLMWSGEAQPELLMEAYALVDPDREPRVVGERLLMANVSGYEMLRAGDRELALRQATTAWGNGKLLEETSVDDPAHWAVTAALIHGGDWDAGLEVVDAVMARARHEGSFLAYATACYVRACPYMNRGELARANADIEVAINARAQGWETYAAAAYWIRSEVLRELDRPEDALAAVVFDPEDEQAWQTNPVFTVALVARAEAFLALGRAEEGLAAARQAGALSEAAFGGSNPALVAWGSAAGLAAARLGDIDAGRAFCDHDVEIARRWGAPYPLTRALRCRGLVEKAADGIPYFEEALGLIESTAGRLEHARTLVALGTALRVAGHRNDSRELLRRAHELASATGMLRLARLAQEELAAAGARPRRVSTTGLEALTPSELRVADLAAGGLSNREIAEALFVTKKAVEYHLSNVYRKLDVRGRDDLADALSASGSGSPAST